MKINRQSLLVGSACISEPVFQVKNTSEQRYPYREPPLNMFNNINDVVDFYANESDSRFRNEFLYEEFKKTSSQNNRLRDGFKTLPGFGELAFVWNWYLLVKEMPENFKFLEIGVYKGRVLALVKLCADMLTKNAKIYGVTPLSSSGDKYAVYDQANYLEAIKNAFRELNLSFDSTHIIKGYSQEAHIISEVESQKEFDIIFIDGCHDFEAVCQDIINYGRLVRSGGFLVLDDASLYLENAAGKFKGHPDVAKAIMQELDGNPGFTHLYAVGHNRVWRKI